ncbi:MAG: magnesium transporter [Deltaproteobacteria bacterium]|nr:magnesium transporter [Deltaproteobacteria bacterium]
MLGQLLAPEIEEYLTRRDFAGLRDALSRLDTPEIADLVGELPSEQRALVFRILPRMLATETFEYLEPEPQKDLVATLAQEQVAALLNNMSPDDRTALLEELPAAVTRSLLNRLTTEERKVASWLLGYPEDSIGRLMTPDYVAVEADWTVERVLEHIRQHGQDRETLDVIYVIDPGGKLVDDLRIRELLLARPETRIGDLSDHHFVVLKATEDQEAAVDVFQEYDRVALPVTDSDGVLIGIVTVDDVLDVAEEEATEDIQKIGGSEPLADPYLETPVWSLIQKRARWLILLFLGEMLTASAISYYEVELTHAVVLALFIPLIISSGGNSGSQTATFVIRAMALGEVQLRDWRRVLWRELRSGLALGIVLGLIGMLRIAIWEQAFGAYGPHWMRIGITIGIALVGVVLCGTLSGSMLPFLMRRLGQDPAASSTPFVATLVDVTGILIYFTVASLVLSGTLL